MKKILLTCLVLLTTLTNLFASRVTHTYADGSVEIYYTDMDCRDVNDWVSQHPEWQGIVSCDPEYMTGPPNNGTITINGTAISIKTVKDFAEFGTPKGEPGFSIKDCKSCKEGGSNSYLFNAGLLLAGLVIGILVMKMMARKKN